MLSKFPDDQCVTELKAGEGGGRKKGKVNFSSLDFGLSVLAW